MTYDDNHNLLTQKDNVNGITYTYTYDEDNELTKISANNGFSIVYANENEKESTNEDGDII